MWLDGSITWIQLLRYSVNEHFLPLSRVFIHFFPWNHYDPKIFMFFSAFIQVLTIHFFYLGLNKELPEVRKKPFVFFTSFIILTGFSQKINVTMGLQIFWSITYLGIVLFFYGLNFRHFLSLVLGFVLVAGNMSIWIFLFLIFLLFFAFTYTQDKDRFLLYKKKIFVSFFILSLLSLLVLACKPSVSYNDHSSLPSSLIDLLKFHLWFLASPFSRYQEVLIYIFSLLFYFLL